MNELALFAGAGGGILASHLLGITTVCAVERDAYAASILLQRQNDRILPPFPIWDDVCTFDGKNWRGHVDLVSGGFPCQDISAAGNGEGIEGSRSGLWKQMHRIVDEVRPAFVFMENSPLLVKRGLAVVIGDLAEIGYDVEWMCLSAAECGAPHKRDRFWGLAYPGSLHEQGEFACGTDKGLRKEQNERSTGSCGNGFGRWPAEPGMGRVVNGLAGRVDRIKCLGNGQVPRVAATAFIELMARYKAVAGHSAS